ncbi:MAG: DUF1549 and DUF1553 domain-containing protein [Fuerstiella sp.]|nr:DUF1549 and DUF1553 domain-containing protein [Fuerstiella sp.]
MPLFFLNVGLMITLGLSLLSGSSTSAVESVPSTVEFIDQQIARGWDDNEVKPSRPAPDEEWVRRIYLDIAGRIPSLQETTDWLGSRDPRKKSVLIESLLDGSDYVRNFTAIWTNACIGRGTPRRVSRNAMEKFFREAFAKGRPWDEVVRDLVTAEGHFEENGAVNYILAQTQMRDDAVQLTARTTRLFLGIQVQCTQCHDHPFNNWQQSQFWQYNSFFRQVRRIDRRRQDPESGRIVDDYSEVVRGDFKGPVYFEKRNGLMQVAFPEFQGRKVDPGTVDRRAEFGRLLMESVEGESPLIAQAFVNRMWAHFFGYGFTRPVDDLGPHNPPSHPDLLSRLGADFAAADYDVRQLIRWITNSQAYSLSSKLDKNNRIDNPSAGEMPLFSHAYLKSMEAEQLYDSLIVATNAHQSGNTGWDKQERQRRRWMQQFVVAFDNDENNEATTFNGTIPQAMMLMNSELTQKAVNAEEGSFLHQVLSRPGSDGKKLQQLYLAAFSRRPTRSEISRARRLFRVYGKTGQVAAFQDLFWALLNSNEFIMVH